MISGWISLDRCTSLPNASSLKSHPQLQLNLCKTELNKTFPTDLLEYLYFSELPHLVAQARSMRGATGPHCTLPHLLELTTKCCPSHLISSNLPPSLQDHSIPLVSLSRTTQDQIQAGLLCSILPPAARIMLLKCESAHVSFMLEILQ